MAPSHPNFHAMLKRQDDGANTTETGQGGSATAGVPACVVTCMASAPTTGCSGADDWACLCASTEFINSVGACWTSSCSASDAVYGQAYANQACAFYGVPLGGNSTSTSTPTSETEPSGTAVLSPPQITSHSFVKVQAAMSSICSLLFALALIMGVLSCRARYKREQAATQNRTWNGVTGLTTMDSKAPSKSKTSRFFNKSTHSSAFETSRGGATTFQSENFGVTSSNFGGSTTLNNSPHTQSFGIAPAAGGRPDSGGARFTNRLTLGEMGNKSEEWELSDVNLKKDEVDGFNDVSPTSFDGKMESEMESRLADHENSGIDSTVALNVLPKEGNGRTHAI
ncbi:hypothetical protein I302_100322 [Kwoniella bestiolae CBS 10118]|uniref:CFEM domain-containing protein n=1 Tax=Kwoniella bestiolae CBS 10118 TaxID=1296100 RepID=A0A1B9G4P8_9TREE|nr:hypothetical protein I302_03694 [Kwoniella bestiolae CBS 10118]OCF26017.1 hypothetical protein I302_03694 [Kwoniella bestiolae CBS 10118]